MPANYRYYGENEENGLIAQLRKFLAQYWKLLAVIGVAAAVGMAVFIAAAYFPPVLLGLGALTIKGIAPFAFLTTLPTSFAAAILSTMAVGVTYAVVGLAAAAKFLYSKISSKNELLGEHANISNLYSVTKAPNLASHTTSNQKQTAPESTEFSSVSTPNTTSNQKQQDPQASPVVTIGMFKSGTQSQPGNKETELRSSFGR